MSSINGTCVLCGRESQRIGDLLEVNGQPVELCGPCLGIPVAVLLLDLAHLGKQALAALPPPPNADTMVAPVG
jgi:hypothetical protein